MAESLSGASGAPIQGKEILGPPDIARSLFRIAHEILERNHGTQDIVVLGIPSGGAPLAHRLVEALAVAAGEGTQWSEQAEQAPAAKVPVGTLDITMYRDDLGRHPIRVPRPTEIPQGGIDGKVVILVDDVLYSGRTIRAALDALGAIGRPRAVQLAALAQALRQECWATVQALLVEMDWVAPFCRAMARLDGEGYYGVMAEELPAALTRVSMGYGTGQEER